MGALPPPHCIVMISSFIVCAIIRVRVCHPILDLKYLQCPYNIGDGYHKLVRLIQKQ